MTGEEEEGAEEEGAKEEEERGRSSERKLQPFFFRRFRRIGSFHIHSIQPFAYFTRAHYTGLSGKPRAQKGSFLVKKKKKTSRKNSVRSERLGVYAPVGRGEGAEELLLGGGVAEVLGVDPGVELLQRLDVFGVGDPALF